MPERLEGNKATAQGLILMDQLLTIAVTAVIVAILHLGHMPNPPKRMR